MIVVVMCMVMPPAQRYESLGSRQRSIWTLIELAIVTENEARKGNVSTQKRKMKILKSNGAGKQPADLHTAPMTLLGDPELTLILLHKQYFS